MSAFGGKADMAFCGISLSWSLLGVKRSWLVAAHMSAFDAKRTLDLSPTRYRKTAFREFGQVPVQLGRKVVQKTGLAILVTALSVASAQAQSAAGDLNSRNIERRAVEAVIWGMSAVNTDLMRQEMLAKTNGKVNQFI